MTEQEYRAELLAAAAYAAVNPRAYWARRRPPQAIEYLSQVRLGQTERGSYVVTMVPPVTPALHGDGLTVAPFERRVTETLMQALRAASHAAQAAAESGNMAPFNDAVAAGVSANLCDALAGLGQASPKDGLEISVSWSRTRPGQGTLTSIPFSSDYLPILREASRRFKEAAPREELDLFGLVVKLDRVPGNASGTVAVDALVDDLPRRVFLELGDPFYQEAIRAHKESMLISCTGELVKDGKSLRLRNPAQFQVFSPESESL